MKIGFIIYYGPEIRTFVVSKLIETLVENNDVVLINKLPLDNQAFSVLNKVKQIPFPDSKSSNNIFDKIHSYLYDLHVKFYKSKMKIKGHGEFHFSDGINKDVYFLDYLKGSNIVLNIISLLMKIISYAQKENIIHTNFFNTHKFDKIVYSSSFDSDCLKFLLSCRKRKINLNYILSNWKDVYMYHYFHFIPDKLFYWSSQLSDFSKTHNKLPSENIFISGNPYFYPFLSKEKDLNQNKLYSNYNIDNDDKVIIWATGQDSMLGNEEKIISDFNDILHQYLENPPIIFIRKNPFSKVNYKLLAKKFENIRICNNYWIKNNVVDFLYLTEKGETEWKILLNITDLIISVPSTVVLEASLKKIKVFNFIFNSSDEIIEKLYHYTQSSFYKPLVQSNHCVIETNINNLANNVINFIKEGCVKHDLDLPKIIEGNILVKLEDLAEKIYKT